MKKLFLKSLAIGLLALIPAMSWAGVSSDYAFSTGVDATKWVTLSSPTQIITPDSYGSDSKASAVTNIGFTFNFGGTDYTEFSVNTDGNLRFGSTVTGTNAYTNPFAVAYSTNNANINTPKINFMGCDGKMKPTGYIKSEVFGTEPNRYLVVEYSNTTYSDYSKSQVLSWQIQLFETSNKILVVYGTAPSVMPSPTKQIGMCTSATDILLVNISSNTVKAYSAATSDCSAENTWPAAGRYYEFKNATCFPPTNVQNTSVGKTTASFTWAASGKGETQYQYVCVAKGTSPDWSSATLTSDLSATVNSGLMAGKQYDFYVRSYCSADDQSNAATYSFVTECDKLALPATINFDDMPYATGTTAAVATDDVRPLCWEMTSTSATANYKPFIIKTSDTGNSPALYVYGNKSTAYAVLPELAGTVDISKLKLSFSGKGGTISVGMMEEGNFVQVGSAYFSTSSFESKSFLFSSYTGTSKKIAFKFYVSNYTSTYFYVDDISLVQLECATVPASTVSNITSTSADIATTYADGAWQIQLNGDTTIDVASGTSFTVTNLAPNTAYTVKTRSNCGNGKYGDWVNGAGFTTLCSYFEVAELALTTFETDAEFRCWKHAGTTTTTASEVHDGSRAFKLGKMGTDVNYLITPEINADVDTLQLTFFAKGAGNSTEKMQTLIIGVSSDGTVANFDSLGQVTLSADSYQRFVYNFKNYSGEAKYIGFMAQKTSSTYIYACIDNVSIAPAPDCAIPTGVVVSDTSANSATISWTAGGDESAWNLRYRPTNGAWDTISGLTTNSYALSELSAAKKYEVEVQAVCSATETSDWTTTVSFTTLCGVITLPYNEGFEDFTIGNSTAAAPGCWALLNANDGAFPYIFVNNSTSYVKTGSKSLYFQSSSSRYGYAIFPELGAKLNCMDVSFWHKYEHSTSSGKLTLGYMTDITDESTFVPIKEFTRSTSGSNGTANLSELVSADVTGARLAFRYGGGSNNYYMGIDDIVITKLLATPSNLAVASKTASTVTVTFSQDDEEASSVWNYELYDNNSYTGTAKAKGTVAHGSAKQIELTELEEGSRYYLRVNHQTSAKTSGWVKLTVTTSCPSVDSIPFGWGFKQAQDIPACWTYLGKEPSISSNRLFFSDSCVAYLPTIDYGTVGFSLSELQLSFTGITSANSAEIAVVVTSDFSEMVVLDTIELLKNNLKDVDVYLRDYTTKIGSNTYIGFYNIGGQQWSLDTVTIKEETARIPESLEVINLSSDSAQITFVQNEPNKKKGWKYQYSVNEDYTGADTLSLGKNDEKKITLKGLEENTTYYFRIRQSGAGENAPWANIHFTTECASLKLSPFVYKFDGMTVGSSPKCFTVGKSGAGSNPTVVALSETDTVVSLNGGSLYSALSYFAMPEATEQTVMAKLVVKFKAKTSNDSYNKMRVGVVADFNSMSTFAGLDTLTLTTDFADYTVSLDEYTGDGKYIVFYTKGSLNGSNTAYYQYIDDITIEEVSCQAPQGLQLEEVQANQATISTSLSNVKLCAKVGDNVFEGTDGASQVTITGLDASTTYKAEVYVACSATDTSAHKTFGFTTECEAKALPMDSAEGFEGCTTSFPNCWYTITNNDHYPKVCGTAYEGKKGVNIDGGNQALVLPEMSGDFSTRKLEFYAKGNGTFYVITVDGNTTVDNLANQEKLATLTISSTSDWARKEVFFSEIDGINAKMAGKRLAIYETANIDFYVDNVWVKNDDLRSPENVATYGEVTTTAATINFTQPKRVADSRWYYEVATDKDFASVVKSDTINDTIFSLSELTFATTYYVQVKHIVNTASSDWSTSYDFTTACVKVVLDKVYTFDDVTGSATDPGYQRSNYTYNKCWVFGNQYGSSYKPYIRALDTCAQSTPNSIEMAMYSYYSSYNYKTTYYPSWVAMPELDEDDMSLVRVEFYASAYNNFNLQVGVMSDPSAISTFTADSIVTIQKGGKPHLYTVYLKSHTEDMRYIAFNTDKVSGTVFLDNIVVKKASCGKATGAAASAITANSATISITNATPDWNIVVKAGETVAFSKNDITSANVEVTGLSAQTNYVAEIRMNCSDETESDPVEVKFTTECAAVTLPYEEDFSVDNSQCWTFNGYMNWSTANKNLNVWSTGNYMVLPEFADDLSNARMTFDAKCSSGKKIKVRLADNIDDLNISTGTEVALFTLTSSYATYTVNFYEFEASVVAGKKYILITAETASDNPDVYYQNVRVAEAWDLLRGNLSANQIGTACQEKNITDVRGGVLYGVNYGTTASIEFVEKELPIAAGEPLLFQADGSNDGKIEVVYGDATATAPVGGEDGVRGFVGNLSSATSNVDIESGNILISGGMLRLAGTGCYMGPGRAYIKAEELPDEPITSAPARARRLVLTQNGTAVATGADEVMMNNADGILKVVRDGQLLIIKGGRMYNAQGQVLR